MAAADLLARNPDPSEDEIRARRSRATSAAARATTTSSRRCSTPPSTAGAEARPEPRRGGAGMSVQASRQPTDASRRQRLRRPGAQAQGGPAPDHRPGHLRRRHRRCRACCTRRSCARPRRTRGSCRSTPRPRSSAPASRPSSRARTSTDMAAPCPMVWVPPGVEVRVPDHWPLARGKVGYVGQAVAVVIGARQVRASSTPPRTWSSSTTRCRSSSIPRRRSRTASPLVHEEFGTNKVLRVVARRRRRRGRARATPTSSSSGGSSTTAPPARRSSRAACSPSWRAGKLTLW